MSLLHYALRSGRFRITDTLLQAGADVNRQGNHGESPLHEASRTGSVSVVSLLLSYGANVNAEDHRGRTPLHYAANHEVAAVLLDLGANHDSEDNDETTSHPATERIEAWSSSSSRLRGRQWFRYGAHSRDLGDGNSSDNETRLSDADRGSRERDLAKSAVQMMKERLKGSKRLGRWLKTDLLKHHGATSYITSSFLGRRSEKRRCRCPRTTVMNRDSPESSPSTSLRGYDSDRVSLKTSGRKLPSEAKVIRRHGRRARSFCESEGQYKHGRRNCKTSCKTQKTAAIRKGALEGWRTSWEEDTSSDSRGDKEEDLRGLSNQHVVGPDRSGREFKGDPAERAAADLPDSSAAGEKSPCSGSDRTRNRRLTKYDDRNRPSKLRTTPNLFGEEFGWMFAFWLVRSIRAAIETSAKHPPETRESLNRADKDAVNGAEGPARRRQRDRSTATQSLTKPERMQETERGGKPARRAGMGCSRLSTGRDLKKQVDPVGAEKSRQEESNTLHEAKGTMSETETPRTPLVHDHDREGRDVGVGTRHEACCQESDSERAARNGSPRARLGSDDFRRVSLTGDGGADSTETDMVEGAQVLLGSTTKALPGCQSCSSSKASPQLPETMSSGVLRLDAAEASHATLQTTSAADDSSETLHQGTNSTQRIMGEEDDGETNLERTANSNGRARSSDGSSPASLVIATMACEAAKRVAENDDRLPTPPTAEAQADTSGTIISMVQEVEVEQRLGQSPCAESDVGEAASLRTFPMKSVADQLRDLSDRLSRICVLPVS